MTHNVFMLHPWTHAISGMRRRTGGVTGVKKTARTVLPNRETHSVIITHLLYNPALEWLEGPSPKAQLEEVLKTRPRFGVARDLKPSGRIVCAEAVRGRNVLLSTRSSC